MAIGRLVGYYRAGPAWRPEERERTRQVRASCLTVMGMAGCLRSLWSAPAALCSCGGVWPFFASLAAWFAGFAGLATVPYGLGVPNCRAVFLKSPICECRIHIMGFNAAHGCFRGTRWRRLGGWIFWGLLGL